MALWQVISTAGLTYYWPVDTLDFDTQNKNSAYRLEAELVSDWCRQFRPRCCVQINHRSNATQFCVSDLQLSDLPLDFRDDGADAILLAHAQEHASDLGKLLDECLRVGTDDARLLVFAWNPWSPFHARRPKSSTQDPQLMSRWALRRKLREHGWYIEGVTGYLCHPMRTNVNIDIAANHRLERLGRLLWPWLGCGYAIAASRKSKPLMPLGQKWRFALPNRSARLVTSNANRQQTDKP